MDRIRDIGIYAKALGKWGILSAVVGAISGLAAALFYRGVEGATVLRLEHPWMLFLLPALGLAIVGIYRLLGTEDQSANNIIRGIHSGENLMLRLFPSIFLGSILTHLGGGSAGRTSELQMGGTLGHFAARTLRFDDHDIRISTMVGIAAFFSALYGTPLGATVFAMSMVSVGMLYHVAFLPCILASAVSYGISRFFGVAPMRYAVTAPAVAPAMLVRVAVLASLAAFVSVLFCFALHKTGGLFRRYLRKPWLRVLVGAGAIIALSLLFRSGRYNGSGVALIAAAVEEGQALPADFLLKILFTAITLGAGFKGGEIIPSFCIGATFGCVMGPLLGIPAGFAAAIGMIAVFCGSVNCPLASIFLAVEIFGAGGLLYFALACGLAFVLSGYSGIYSSQKILYDKLKARYRKEAEEEG